MMSGLERIPKDQSNEQGAGVVTVIRVRHF